MRCRSLLLVATLLVGFTGDADACKSIDIRKLNRFVSLRTTLERAGLVATTRQRTAPVDPPVEPALAVLCLLAIGSLLLANTKPREDLV